MFPSRTAPTTYERLLRAADLLVRFATLESYHLVWDIEPGAPVSAPTATSAASPAAPVLPADRARSPRSTRRAGSVPRPAVSCTQRRGPSRPPAAVPARRG